MVICLELGADLHMAQLMPLPLSKIHTGFAFPVLADPGSPGKSAVKWMCVCHCAKPVCICLYRRGERLVDYTDGRTLFEYAYRINSLVG